MAAGRRKSDQKRCAGIPVIDLFAGPGGLGEGFAALKNSKGKTVFSNALSIENNEFAHQTLLLRHFIRSFEDDEIPEEYFKYLKKEIQLDELIAKHKKKFSQAAKGALKLTLCEGNHDLIKRKISSKLKGQESWVLVGGPPCQAYSLVGRSRMMGNPDFEKDVRHFLYKEYLKIISDHWPPVFVMENVKGLLSATVKGESVVGRIVSDLSDPLKAITGRSNGYNYKLFSLTEPDQALGDIDPRQFVVRAEEYGVPQARHRMFFVGVRDDIEVTPRQLDKHAGPTVKQTIGNLPSIRSGLSRNKDTAKNWRQALCDVDIEKFRKQLNGAEYTGKLIKEIKAAVEKKTKYPESRSSKKYPKKFRSNHAALNFLYDAELPVLTSHESRGHMASDLHRYLFCSAFAKVSGTSPKLGDFPESLLPAHKNVELGRAGKMFCDRFRVQIPGSYSTTITSHISKDGHYFIHYDPLQCRSLTVREAARLQTFPDNYHFEGPRTSQYHQVGNAVPPYLARQIAEIVSELILSGRKKNA